MTRCLNVPEAVAARLTCGDFGSLDRQS
jgi:hypothetical protein